MIILHNYAESPYAEKIRAMLGYTGLDWQSVDVPPQPPRPSLDPVLGGYRRIPVMQDGADLYCDTAIISREIAERSGNQNLNPASLSADDLALNQHFEDEVFMACVMASASPAMLVKMVLRRGPLGVFRFMKDRIGAAQEGGFEGNSRDQAMAVWADHTSKLNDLLAGKTFLGGDQPGHLDFSAYHTAWMFKESKGRSPGTMGSALESWQKRMEAFGHGSPGKMKTGQALDTARDAAPKPIAEEMKAGGEAVGIAPTDYMRAPTTGQLVGEDDQTWTIARETDRAGLIHVHFPKAGFALTAV